MLPNVSIRKAALIYNPEAGRKRARRERDVAAATEVLAATGVQVLAVPTRAAGLAAGQAAEAVAAGCDLVIACGGDGTVNEVLQGTMGSGGRAALGIIPLGTANQLAHELGIPQDAGRAAAALLAGARRAVPVGKAEVTSRSGGTGSRYFLVAAGIGPDAEMMYRMTSARKQRFGMSAYYAEGLRLFLDYDYRTFTVEFAGRRETVSGLLAVRIAHFRGLLRELAPGADLARPELRLVLFKTRKRTSYLRYLLGVATRRHWSVPGVELADASQVKAYGGAVQVEVDGEYVGGLPARLTLAQETCTLLVPRRSWQTGTSPAARG